jgi:hypothetical protein
MGSAALGGSLPCSNILALDDDSLWAGTAFTGALRNCARQTPPRRAANITKTSGGLGCPDWRSEQVPGPGEPELCRKTRVG